MLLKLRVAVEWQAEAGVGGSSVSHLQTFPQDEKYYPNIIPRGLCKAYIATLFGRGTGPFSDSCLLVTGGRWARLRDQELVEARLELLRENGR